MRLRKVTTVWSLLASFAVLGAAAGVSGLSTFATFTSAATASQSITTGSVTVTLGAAGPANRLGVNATGVAPGDTMQRAFDLTNSGSLMLASVTLTTTAEPSSLLDTDATNGLQMTIDKCSVAWTESGPPYTYTCGGTTSTVLASREVIGTDIALSNVSDLYTPSTTDRLRLTLTLPSTAGNTFQGLTSTITYTFTGTQRASTDQ